MRSRSVLVRVVLTIGAFSPLVGPGACCAAGPATSQTPRGARRSPPLSGHRQGCPSRWFTINARTYHTLTPNGLTRSSRRLYPFAPKGAACGLSTWTAPPHGAVRTSPSISRPKRRRRDSAKGVLCGSGRSDLLPTRCGHTAKSLWPENRSRTPWFRRRATCVRSLSRRASRTTRWSASSILPAPALDSQGRGFSRRRADPGYLQDKRGD